MDAIATALSLYLKNGGKRQGEQKLRLTPAVYVTPFWQEVEERVRELTVAISDYAGACRPFSRPASGCRTRCWRGWPASWST